MNTVQTAAVIAQAIRKSGYDVMHVSTAFAPIHRDAIVKKIKQRLKRGGKDWTLVATSCVEAGMNFSFRTGFRERASTASLIQIGGRVSRGDEFDDAEVWDILLSDDRFRRNRAITIARQALDRFSVHDLNELHPAELATSAMRQEWTFGAEAKARKLIDLEEKMEYQAVSKECRVIDTDTRTVIIDEDLANAIRFGKKVPRSELMKNSVQIWAYKIEELKLQPVLYGGRSNDSNIYFWQYAYDPEFLGYMIGVLEIEEFMTAGGTII